MLAAQQVSSLRVDTNRSLPSRLLSIGPTAFPVLLAGPDFDQSGVIVAASRHGRGRVVLFGHEGFLTGEAGCVTGWNAVRVACLDWCLQGGPPGDQCVIVGADVTLCEGHAFAQGKIGNRSLKLVRLSRADLFTDRCHLFVTSSYSESHSDRILSFVASGGCLLSGGQAWHWSYSNPGKSVLRDFPGNRWLCPMGLGITAVSAEDCSRLRAAAGDAPGLVAMVTAAAATGSLTDEGAAASLKFAGDQVFVDATVGLSSFETAWEALRKSADSARPESMNRLLSLGLDLGMWLTPLLLREHENSQAGTRVLRCSLTNSFPGELFQVSSDVIAASIIAVTVDASYPGLHNDYVYSAPKAPVWRGTGAYAPPGCLVVLEAPAFVANKGLQMLIGCHTDLVPAGKARPPRIHCLFSIVSSLTRGLNPYGGIVYVLIPPGSSLGKHEIRIRGCVPYPVYSLSGGEETDEQAASSSTSPESHWLDELRTTTAPMFELRVPGQLVISAPTEIGRGRLLAPGPVHLRRLARLWQQIMCAINKFHSVCEGGEARPREERIVLDRAISAGSMHSGYPVMGYLDYDECLLSVDKMTSRGSWGPVHELCHNHQWSHSEFAGTDEASNNVPNVFVHDTVLLVPRARLPDLAPQQRQSRRQAYVAAGRRFASDWNVWVALDTFLQMQEAFGWEPFRELNKKYRAGLPADPTDGSGDQGRMSAYIALFSRIVSRNLAPFFRAWGFPVSEALQKSLGDLPEWTEHPMMQIG